MSEKPADQFTVKFSRYARVLEYEDPAGRLEFTIDGRGKGGLWLEIGDNNERRRDEARYMTAVQRTKKFLESSWGMEVEIFDPRTFDREAARAEQEHYRAKLIAEGKMVVSTTQPQPDPQPKGRSFRLFAWFKALFQ
jgi:hypothetical protein